MIPRGALGALSLTVVLTLAPNAAAGQVALPLNESMSVSSLPNALDVGVRVEIRRLENTDSLTVSAFIPPNAEYHAGNFVFAAGSEGAGTKTTVSRLSKYL